MEAFSRLDHKLFLVPRDHLCAPSTDVWVLNNLVSSQNIFHEFALLFSYRRDVPLVLSSGSYPDQAYKIFLELGNFDHLRVFILREGLLKALWKIRFFCDSKRLVEIT